MVFDKYFISFKKKNQVFAWTWWSSKREKKGEITCIKIVHKIGVSQYWAGEYPLI